MSNLITPAKRFETLHQKLHVECQRGPLNPLYSLIFFLILSLQLKEQYKQIGFYLTFYCFARFLATREEFPNISLKID